MNIKTKFNIGDKVCTIDRKTMKVKQFTVGIIKNYITKGDKVETSYVVEGEGYAGDSYDERFCFANEAELMQYVTTNDE